MLKIINLCKNYGKNKVLKNLNLEIEDGEKVALIGTNGSGKSTLLEVICGIIKKNSGDIYIDNLNINIKKNKNKLKQIIGYMPQFFSLFNDLTVKENLEYLGAIYNVKKDRINQVLNECQLNEKASYLAKNLSGGYKQLLSLAGSIIHSPKLLILDEPTSAMDPVFRIKFWDIIKTLNLKGTTIIVTTHYMEEIAECSYLCCLSNGEIVLKQETSSLDISKDTMKFKKILDMYLRK